MRRSLGVHVTSLIICAVDIPVAVSSRNRLGSLTAESSPPFLPETGEHMDQEAQFYVILSPEIKELLVDHQTQAVERHICPQSVIISTNIKRAED